MLRGEYNQTFSVTVELVDKPMYGGHCLLETWKTLEGVDFRPADLPSITSYHPDTGRIMFQMWTREDGLQAVRPDNKPAVIKEFGDDPVMKWYDKKAYCTFVARPSLIVRDPNTDEIIECIYKNAPEPNGKDCFDLPVPSLNF